MPEKLCASFQVTAALFCSENWEHEGHLDVTYFSDHVIFQQRNVSFLFPAARFIAVY